MALPTTGLTAHFDASSADDLFKTFVSGGPHTGTPVDGESVTVWEPEIAADRIFKQSGANPVPVWRATTPLMSLPCLDFTGGQRLILTNSVNSNRPLSEIITASAYTVLIAFYAETISSASFGYISGHMLLGDSAGYFGAFLGRVSGAPKISVYNYDGNQDYLNIDVTIGAPHVLMMRHQGGSLYASLDGGAESSLASGNTTVITNAVSMGRGSSSAVDLDGRIGEVAVYNTALAGTNLTDAVAYFTGKWLPAPPADARVTQHATEILTLTPVPARVSQYVVEAVSLELVSGRVTQYVVEALASSEAPPAPKDYTWQIKDMPDVTRWMTGLLVFPEGDLDPPSTGGVGAQVFIPMHVTTRVVFPVGMAGWGGVCLCDE